MDVQVVGIQFMLGMLVLLILVGKAVALKAYNALMRKKCIVLKLSRMGVRNEELEVTKSPMGTERAKY